MQLPVEDNPQFAEAVKRLVIAKNHAVLAARTLAEAEKDVLQFVEFGDRKSKTVSATVNCEPFSGNYKVVATKSERVSADCEKILEFCNTAELPAPVKGTFSLDKKGYEWYRENNPEAFKSLSQFVSIRPGKTNVKIVPPKE